MQLCAYVYSIGQQGHGYHKAVSYTHLDVYKRQVFGLPVLSGFMEPIIIFLLPPGGFFVFGMLIALAGKLSKEGHAPESTGCSCCPLAASCSMIQEKEACGRRCV